MSDMFRYLEWDSAFFGFKTAAFTSGRYTFDELDKTIRLMNQGNYTLAYLFADPDDSETNKSAKELGGVPVDEKVTFGMELLHIPVAGIGPEILSYPQGLPEPALVKLAIESGEYSRFRTDKRFPEGSFEELYTQWITNSTTHRIATEVFVYRIKGEIRGMITLGMKDRRGIIGLIAVDEAAKGHGLGKKLVGSAVNYCRQNSLEELQVLTQRANRPACNFYSTLGFRIIGISRVYHFWMK